jgi:hypothetical protein
MSSHFDSFAAFPFASTILADAAATATADQGGWWQQYLSIFKSALLALHGLIDEPLKRVGVEHSWGISIGLFTARK